MKAPAKLFVSVIAAACVALPGCGDSAADGTGSSTTAAVATSAPPATTTTKPADKTSTGGTTTTQAPSNPTGPAECLKLKATGAQVGQVPKAVVLRDERGRDIHFHDFCKQTVLLIAGGMNQDTTNKRWAQAAKLLSTKYTDGSVRVIGLFMRNKEGKMLANAEIISYVDKLTGYRPNGVSLNDSAREGFRVFFPDKFEAKGDAGTVLLKPGFVVVKKDIEADKFEAEIDAVRAAGK